MAVISAHAFSAVREARLAVSPIVESAALAFLSAFFSLVIVYIALSAWLAHSFFEFTFSFFKGKAFHADIASV